MRLIMIDIYNIIKTEKQYIDFIYTTSICHERPVNDNEPILTVD